MTPSTGQAPKNFGRRKIIERLEIHQGVLVQGPPGTGKSHTIVNLICHLLATGQRVLVTSHTARALQVLRQYLKERVSEISPLCVVLLGDDRNALQAMEDSVQGITDRYNVRSAERSVQHIEELKKELDETRREEAILRQEICAIREAETYRHPPRFGDYQGTAQTIAIRLSQEALQYSWFRDRPADEELSITEPEAVEFLYLLRNTELDRAEEVTWIPVNPEGLFPPPGFSVLVRQEEEARKIYDETNKGRDYPAYQYLKSSPEETRGRVANGLAVLVRDFESLVGHIQSWIKDAAREILADQDRHWRELLEVTQTHLNILADRVRWADGIQVSETGRDPRVVRSDAEVLLAHLEKGGKLGWGLFRPKPVKQGLYLIQEVRVDGRLCDRPEVLRDLISYLEVRERIEALRAQWSEYVQISSPSLSRQVAQYHDLCEPLGVALDLHRKMVEIRGVIAEIPGLVEPVWHDIGVLKALLGATEAAYAEERLREAIQAIEKVEEKLRRVVAREEMDPATVMLLEAVRSRSQEGYARAYEVLAGHYTVRQELERRKVLLEKFKEAVPHLSTELSSTADDPTWDERMKQLGAAWNWVRATVWIKRLGDPSAIEQLNLQLDDCHRQIRNLLGKLAAEKAWDHCLAKMKEHEREHLVAWSKAMRRIGKGTGKYVSEHRRAAQEHMEECRTAIPVWVMPIYRVAESIHPGQELFDVVIVDEASQSGPEALFLPYLARKMVIVGDDQQISPDFVGLDRADVNQLRMQYISDLPHRDAYGVDHSLFELAEIRYGGRIRLREHFRCMPEIIQFSNNLCYRSQPLIPLKQYGAGRLSPVVITRHVKDGYVKGNQSVVNPPEADAICKEIVRCCKDPIYRDKTIGVISLQGHYQARHIEKLLLDQLGPEEMERRQLVCGDAYAFQGDERDVIFLSLVAAPTEGRRSGAMSGEGDKRRFNVAASRAREQMWLFYTATLNDLSSSSLRYQLIEYCLHPHIDTVVEGIEIEELRRLAVTADRSRTSAPGPFDSWFEVDVFLKVADQGYRVIPQYEVAGYRIDLEAGSIA